MAANSGVNVKKARDYLMKRSRERRKFLRKEPLMLDVAWRLGYPRSKSEVSLSWLVNSKTENEEKRRKLYQLNPKKYSGYAPRGQGRADEQQGLLPLATDPGGKEQQEMDDILEQGDSSVFIKSNQSKNPHNDYAQHFVDTGERSQNFIHDASVEDRFEEYPKLKELIQRKDDHIDRLASPPMYLKCDLLQYSLSNLGSKFDVICIDPPLEEYTRRYSGFQFHQHMWDFEELMNLKVEEIAANRSFVFFWVGSGDGLDQGRECLRKWGFRRCEDIVWVKSNKSAPGFSYVDQKSVLQNTKEHCLMGIRGTVKRNQDGDFIHANVDLDVVVTEEPEYGDLTKPAEMFRIIEHFCLGRRRLYLFGGDAQIRPGWVTVGPELTSSNFNPKVYTSLFEKDESLLLPFDEKIEELRPKSPPQKSGGRGRGLGGPSMATAPGMQSKPLMFGR